MAKRASSKYLSGARTDDWLKIKISKRQEVVIAGFMVMDPGGSQVSVPGIHTSAETR
jgi:ATP-dependent DNA ligase